MRRGLWGRFAVWTAFLVIIAAALYLSGVGTVAIVVVMFVAWLLVSAVEVALARAAARRHPQVVGRSVSALLDEVGPGETVRVIRRGEEPDRALTQDNGLSLDMPPEEWPERPAAERERPHRAEDEEAAVAGPWSADDGEGFRIVRREREEVAEEPEAAAPPAAEPFAPLPEPESELAPEPEPSAKPEPALVAEPEPAPVAPEPAPPAVPEPAPEPVVVLAPPPRPAVLPAGLPPVAAVAGAAATESAAPPPASPPVARIGHDRPRAWNLWELERLAREVGGRDPARDEARAFLLLYLRDYATADGLLPVEFDPLVRESFADLTQR